MPPSSVPDDGVCTGCGGLFYGHRQPSAVAAHTAKVVRVAAPVSPKKNHLPLILGSIVLVATTGYFAMRKGPAPKLQPQAPSLAFTTPAVAPVAPPKPAPPINAFEPGIYQIVSIIDARVLDVPISETNSGANIKTYAGGTGLNQQFLIKATPSGKWRIIAMHSYKAIAAQSPKVVQAVPANVPDQLWRMEKAGADTFLIRSEADGLALTALPYQPESKGAGTVMMPPDGTPAQAWKLLRVGPTPADFDALDMAFVKTPPAGAPPISFKAHTGTIPANLIPLDFASAATADSRTGLFHNPANVEESVHPTLFGTLNIAGIPFTVPDPASLPAGKNLILLRSAMGFTRDAFPRFVELPINNAAITKLHFIGGVAAWGWPSSKKAGESQAGAAVAKIVIQRTNAAWETYILRNGDVFCDYAKDAEVPGSARIAGLAAHNRQVRYFSLPLTGKGPVKKIVIDSYSNHTAPVFVAITAETGK